MDYDSIIDWVIRVFPEILSKWSDSLIIFLVTKERIKTNIIKNTPYITTLPTFIQIKSINFTYDEINFGIELFLLSN